MKHDITYEQRFLDLFGYKTIGPDNSNRWIILDEKDKEIGYIQLKKIYKGSKKYVPVYAYCTEINNSNMRFISKRKINDKYGNLEENDTGIYSFDIMRKDKAPIHTEIFLNNGRKELRIWGQEYGYMEFTLNASDGLFLNFQSKTENFNIEEVIKYCQRKEKSNYFYQINYYPNNTSDINQNGITREIEGIYSPFFHDDGELEIREAAWQNNHCIGFKENIVKGTVEEMAKRHEMGIESLNHFRYLLRKIFPINGDIISRILDDDIIEKTDTGLFLKEEQNKKIELKIENNKE